MGDMINETFPRCSSLDGFGVRIKSKSDPNEMHLVTWSPYPSEFTDAEGWMCGQKCKGFQYRKECRHVDEAKDLFCGWDGFFDPGEPVEITRTNGEKIKVCPRCRTMEITYAQHAV